MIASSRGSPRPEQSTTQVVDIPSVSEDPLVGLLHLLASTDDEHLRRVGLPDTLALDANGEPKWHFRFTEEGGVRRSSARGWSPEEVKRRFSQAPLIRVGEKVCPAPICAVFITFVEGGNREPISDPNGRGQTTALACDYLTPSRLSNLFAMRRPRGILQRYHPTGARHSVTQAVWTPFLMVVERRRCIHLLDEAQRTTVERTATAATSPHSEEAPLAPARQTEVENACRRIYSSTLRQTNQMISRMCVYFATQPLTFLFASSAVTLSGNPVGELLPSPQRPISTRAVQRPPPTPDSPPPLRPGVRSTTTTPAHTPATPSTPNASPRAAFDTRLLNFSCEGRWEEEPQMDLVVVLSGDEAKRPDGYLVVPRGDGDQRDVAPESAAQQRQLYEVAERLPAAAPAPGHSPSMGGASVAARGGSSPPLAARQIAALAAGQAKLQAAGVSSPHRGRKDGVHGVRQKYLNAAQAALLQEGGRSVDVREVDERNIPKPARQHVLKFGPVGGAGRARSVQTRPASAPTSKLLAVLSVVAGDDHEGPEPEPELSQQELEAAAARVVRGRHRAQQQKAKLAPPHASHPLPSEPWPVQVLPPPRASTAPPPDAGPPFRDPAYALSAGEVLEASALASSRSGWLKEQQTVSRATRSQRAREAQWNSSAVSEGMLSHMPRSFTKDYASSRAWLYDLENLKTSSHAQAVLLERQRNAMRRMRRLEDQQRHEQLAAVERERRQRFDKASAGAQNFRPADGGSVAGILSAAKARAQGGDYTSEIDPDSPAHAPAKLGRKPLNTTGDQHQSLTEALRSQPKRSARKLMQEASAQRSQMKCATIAPHVQHSTILDALFAPRRDPSERQQMAEEASRIEQERRRQSEQRRDYEERARRLEALRQKRQRQQQLREETKIRSQYSAIEAKYHNQLAVDFVEDILYRAYSRGLEAREVGSRGGARPSQGGTVDDGEIFRFTVPQELWGSIQELHSTLMGLRFRMCDEEGEPMKGPHQCPVSPGLATYCVSSDKVVLSNVMQELAHHKTCVDRVFAQREVAVIQRLKELIDGTTSGGGMPLFEAVKVIRKEFAHLLEHGENPHEYDDDAEPR
eukprot:Hpha_TRINITY_DN9235_c0_g1::TRINITY_DN9235_c0_g1_i1::g.28826::m.28826